MHFLQHRLWRVWVQRLCTAALASVSLKSLSAELSVAPLPPLIIEGQPLRAHTQGMEWVDGNLFVTARREDVSPHQPLLLRTRPGAKHWDLWNLAAPVTNHGSPSMDHPGGFQFDGRYLWIPLAESRRNGRSVIGIVDPAELKSGAPVTFVREFSVADHIGAIAVAVDRNRVLGASWDTASIWVWDLQGTLVDRISAAKLRLAALGVDVPSGATAGLTVQDWKWRRGKLLASGLWKDGTTARSSGVLSRLAVFEGLPGTDTEVAPQWQELPRIDRVEMAREGMAVAEGHVWFLPDDLGLTNRLYSTSELLDPIPAPKTKP